MASTSPDIRAPRIITASYGQTFSLQPLVASDLEEFYTLHADARTWTHYPSARHTSIERSDKDLQRSITEWQTGVGYWSIKSPEGKLVGVGGIRAYLNGACWNIYYRISPEYQGLGLATQMALEAVKFAKEVNPDLAVVSYMLATNPSSSKVAEKIGFIQQWEGPDAGNPDPQAIRCIYSDRQLKQDVLDGLIAFH